MMEYNTPLSYAVERLEDEVKGYETYKWLLTTEEVKSDPELYTIFEAAMVSEKQHASELLRWVTSKIQ